MGKERLGAIQADMEAEFPQQFPGIIQPNISSVTLRTMHLACRHLAMPHLARVNEKHSNASRHDFMQINQSSRNVRKVQLTGLLFLTFSNFLPWNQNSTRYP